MRAIKFVHKQHLNRMITDIEYGSVRGKKKKLAHSLYM